MVVESTRPPRHPDLLARRRAGDRRQRRPDRRHRLQQAARPLHQAPGRLRQHVHVRAPGAASPQRYPTPKPQPVTAADARRELRAARDRRGADRARLATERARRQGAGPQAAPSRAAPERPQGAATQAAPRPAKERLFAQPVAPERVGRRRRPAGVRAHRHHRRRRELRGLLQRDPRPRPRRGPAQAAAARLRAWSPARSSAASARLDDTRAAPAVRDPAGRPRRPARSTRSRSSTAGSCSSRPRSTAPRARTRSSAPTRRTRRSGRSC